jgi:hypothetical protein
MYKLNIYIQSCCSTQQQQTEYIHTLWAGPPTAVDFSCVSAAASLDTFSLAGRYDSGLQHPN